MQASLGAGGTTAALLAIIDQQQQQQQQLASERDRIGSKHGVDDASADDNGDGRRAGAGVHGEDDDADVDETRDARIDRLFAVLCAAESGSGSSRGGTTPTMSTVDRMLADTAHAHIAVHAPHATDDEPPSLLGVGLPLPVQVAQRTVDSPDALCSMLADASLDELADMATRLQRKLDARDECWVCAELRAPGGHQLSSAACTAPLALGGRLRTRRRVLLAMDATSRVLLAALVDASLSNAVWHVLAEHEHGGDAPRIQSIACSARGLVVAVSSAGNALLGFQIDLMRARAVLAQAITPGAPAPAQSLAWRTLGAASCSPLAALVVADAETEARDGSDSDSDDVDGGAQADSVLLACGHALVAVAARDGAPTAPPLGSEFTSGSRDGAGECARFARPAAVALDGAAGTLWVADTGNSAVRHVTWYARQSSHATPQAVAATSVRDDDRLAHASCIACSTCRDRVYIGGRTSSTLLELDPFSGALAGVATLPAPPVALCALDGGALAALCEQTAPAGAPRAPVVVCVLRPPVRAACRALQQLALTHSCTYAGTSGSGVVVCTSARHSIELWDTRTGMPRVLAGRADEPGYADGAPGDARFRVPLGVASDALGNVYVADAGNHRVRRVDGRTGFVTTIAGTGRAGYATGGPATASDLDTPHGLAFDAADNVLRFTSEPFLVTLSPANGHLHVVGRTGAPRWRC